MQRFQNIQWSLRYSDMRISMQPTCGSEHRLLQIAICDINQIILVASILSQAINISQSILHIFEKSQVKYGLIQRMRPPSGLLCIAELAVSYSPLLLDLIPSASNRTTAGTGNKKVNPRKLLLKGSLCKVFATRKSIRSSPRRLQPAPPFKMIMA